MRGERIGALVALAALVRDRDLARLGAATREVGALRDRIAALDAALAARRDELRCLGGADMALTHGVDQKWRALVESRRTALNETLAVASARRDEASYHAARAVGRVAALDRLARQMPDRD